MIESRDFMLDRLEREARELATCVVCYGVGQALRFAEESGATALACEACAGRGRAAREPHVLTLVAMVRRQDVELSELARDRYRESLRAKRAEEALREAESRIEATRGFVEAGSAMLGQVEEASSRRDAAERRAALAEEARLQLVAMVASVEVSLDGERIRRGNAEALAAATVERLMRAEEEQDELRREIERLRAERYRLLDELAHSRQRERQE